MTGVVHIKWGLPNGYNAVVKAFMNQTPRFLTKKFTLAVDYANSEEGWMSRLCREKDLVFTNFPYRTPT